MRLLIIIFILYFAILFPIKSYAESGCKEYKIIDHGNSVEAVCVGEPATEEEVVNLDKLKEVKQTQIKSQPEVTDLLNSTQTKTAPQTANNEIPVKESVDISSYDVKYLRDVNTRRFRRLASDVSPGSTYIGEYSIKIAAKNNGNKGLVRFKLKILDFSGFELMSLTFDEFFDKDENKTVTSLQPGNPVSFIRSSDWIIDAYKVDGILIK